jgi:predicted nucleic acid-binding protein
MPESLFVDTGYILALVNENDQHHAEALVLSERYDGQPIVVTDAVLLEIGNALSRMDRNAAVQIIQDLRESQGATVVNLTPACQPKVEMSPSLQNRDVPLLAAREGGTPAWPAKPAALGRAGSGAGG